MSQFYFLIDTAKQTILGAGKEKIEASWANTACIEAPAGFVLEQLDEWQLENSTPVLNPEKHAARRLNDAKQRIKSMARLMISDSDWKLNRAKERESAGMGTLAEVDCVLMHREKIRQLSNALEEELEALPASAWLDDPNIEQTIFAKFTAPQIEQTPCQGIQRVTQYQFAEKFTNEEMAAILSAGQSNKTIAAWWEKFRMASFVNLQDEGLKMGLNALAMANVLTAERVADILGEANG